MIATYLPTYNIFVSLGSSFSCFGVFVFVFTSFRFYGFSFSFFGVFVFVFRGLRFCFGGLRLRV